MAVNPFAMLHMKERLEIFNRDHPRFMPFLQAVGASAVQEGTILEVKVTTPDGRDYVTNIRLNADDLETIEMMK